MLAAAFDFGWETAKSALLGSKGLTHLHNAIDAHLSIGAKDDTLSLRRSHKIRVALHWDGHLEVTSSEIAAVRVDSLFPSGLPDLAHESPSLVWNIYLSPVRTAPSKYTRHKTTHRVAYDEVRKHLPVLERSPFPERQMEILVVNEEDDIMEGSITTPYFFRSGCWITPPENAGGNSGTTRRWSLEKGWCREATIRKAEIKMGEIIGLSNGVRGWGFGTVVKL